MTQNEDRFDLVLLTPTKVQLFRTGGDAVRATINDPKLGTERSYLRVQIARAFPFTLPDQWIGLRDGRDNDIGIFETLEGMDAESRAIVDYEMARRYYLPKVLKVHSLKEEFGIVTWDVETDKGRKQFIVQDLRGSTHALSATRVLVTDREGNRYEFPDIRQLDSKTLTLMGRAV
jgi:hypothetical protein